MAPDPLAGIHRLTDFEPLARPTSRSGPSATVAFKATSVGRKTMLASLANLDVIG